MHQDLSLRPWPRLPLLSCEEETRLGEFSSCISTASQIEELRIRCHISLPYKELRKRRRKDITDIYRSQL